MYPALVIAPRVAMACGSSARRRPSLAGECAENVAGDRTCDALDTRDRPELHADIGTGFHPWDLLRVGRC